MQTKKSDMPDVALSQAPQIHETLNWVGMSNIALPLTIEDKNLGKYNAQTLLETYVNVANAETKGIHMSRLYLLLGDFAKNKTLTITSLKEFMQEKLLSHEGISDEACLHINFDYFINRPALKSEYNGWKDYSCFIKAQSKQGKVTVEIGVKIPYSSTCPCSAALSRQLLQQAFLKDFSDQETIDKNVIQEWLRSEKGSVATPHSQRSYADIWVTLGDDCDDFIFSDIINNVENSLQTAVQTAVKREDEQEFARLNGTNQMFCEDAARRVKQTLLDIRTIDDFWVRIEHIESLHAHDAVAMTTKGMPNGYQPLLHR